MKDSLPVMTLVEPIAGIVIGVAAFGEHIPLRGLALLAEAGGLALAGAGVLAIGRGAWYRQSVNADAQSGRR